MNFSHLQKSLDDHWQSLSLLVLTLEIFVVICNLVPGNLQSFFNQSAFSFVFKCIVNVKTE